MSDIEVLGQQSDSRFLQAGIKIATVKSVQQYEAVSVAIPGEPGELPIVAHLSDVPPLRAGDTIVVLGTDQGLVVSGRLRKESESPFDGVSCKDGKLQLQAGKSICIKSGHAMIELTASGKIKIDGKSIYSLSEGRHRLQGSTIELN